MPHFFVAAFFFFGTYNETWVDKVFELLLINTCNQL